MNTPPSEFDDELPRNYMRPIVGALFLCFLIAILTLVPWPESMRFNPLQRNMLWIFAAVVFTICALRELFSFLSRR